MFFYIFMDGDATVDFKGVSMYSK